MRFRHYFLIFFLMLVVSSGCKKEHTSPITTPVAMNTDTSAYIVSGSFNFLCEYGPCPQQTDSFNIMNDTIFIIKSANGINVINSNTCVSTSSFSSASSYSGPNRSCYENTSSQSVGSLTYAKDNYQICFYNSNFDSISIYSSSSYYYPGQSGPPEAWRCRPPIRVLSHCAGL